MARPKLAVWKFASCDGCQLTLLDCRDELLALAREVEIAHFAEASSAEVRRPLRRIGGRGLGHHGRGCTAHPADPRPVPDAHHDRRVRHRRGHPGAAELRRRRRLHRRRLRTPGIHRHARHLHADRGSRPRRLRVRGCPIDRRQLLELLSAMLAGRKPRIPGHSVCYECKGRGTPCVMVAHGTPCLGPVTRPAAVPSARPTAGAAMAASARSRNRTPRPSFPRCACSA